MGVLLRPAVWLFGALPWSVAQRFGRRLGGLAWILARRDRVRALRHLEVAYPELPPDRRREIAHACFRHLGTSAAELLHVCGRRPEAACTHVRVEGFDHVERARAAGRPILILTGHCGNWELIATTNLSHGMGIAAMARELDDAPLNRFALEVRDHLGGETIMRGSSGSSRQMLRVLRAGGALAMLIDQDFRTDGVFVPFFGRLAHTTRAPAELALRLGARVVPVFDERLEDGTHLVRFQPALDLPDGAVEATVRMTSAIEAQVRRRPEQWVWMHRRWRRRPPGEEAAPHPPEDERGDP